jgi:hypothetical protein
MEPDPNTAQQWRESRPRKPSEERPPTEAPPGRPVEANSVGPVQQQAKPSSRKRSGTSRQVLVDPQVPMLDVAAALKEITQVPAATIHRAAAFTWASRAIAGYRVCAGKRAIQEGLSYLYLGEHYREAALAHAAMGEAWQPLFAEIDEAMAKDRQRAFTSMRGRAPVATR